MMVRLLRTRVLASLLLLVSPGVAGTLLPVLHPCPVDAPWLAAGREEGRGHGAHLTHNHEGRTSGHHTSCSCIGRCLVAGAAAPPAPPSVRGIIVPASSIGWPSHDSSLDLAPTSALLPPATAPPVA